jgi:catechol 2,3-dioxygenase-like lactoylglutathione lyase family enzyme
MPLTQLEHYLVLTADLDGTRDFYRDALGLREGARPPLGFPGYWLYVGDVPCIHIAEWNTYGKHSIAAGISVTAPATGTGPLDHIAFNAVDLAGVKARLTAHKIEYSVNEVPTAGLIQLFLKDPNGVKIEINVR